MSWIGVLPSGGMASTPRRPSKKRDENQAAASILSQIISDTEKPTQDEISRVMADLGSKGGKKGGPARARSLSDRRRRQIASQAAKARWKVSMKGSTSRMHAATTKKATAFVS